MTPRTIVTSQPDVACDVCERRLLRGEQPDVFIAAGRRRIVCELCAPRAAHEGWMRETEGSAMTLPPMRSKRGRSFIDRLRQVGRPGAEQAEPRALERAADAQPGGYDFLAPSGPAPAPARPRAATEAHAAEGAGEAEAWVETGAGAEAERAPAPALASYPELALDAFNASEFPRRVAGVARSLGAPEVSVRSAEHLESVVQIVVAWELCWYRYEVDLSEGAGVVQVMDQGTELSELPREDRQANAQAAEGGALALLGA